MNAKQRLKREVRTVENAIAPIAEHLRSEGFKPNLHIADNGRIGVVHLTMAIPNIPTVTDAFVAKIKNELTALGLRADHEIFPLPGRKEQAGVIFAMIVEPSVARQD